MSSKGDNFEYVTKYSALIIVLRKSTVIRHCCAEQCRMEETDSWRRNCENWGLTLEMTTSRAQVTWLSRSHPHLVLREDWSDSFFLCGCSFCFTVGTELNRVGLFLVFCFYDCMAVIFFPVYVSFNGKGYLRLSAHIITWLFFLLNCLY